MIHQGCSAGDCRWWAPAGGRHRREWHGYCRVDAQNPGAHLSRPPLRAGRGRAGRAVPPDRRIAGSPVPPAGPPDSSATSASGSSTLTPRRGPGQAEQGHGPTGAREQDREAPGGLRGGHFGRRASRGRLQVTLRLPSLAARERCDRWTRRIRSPCGVGPEAFGRRHRRVPALLPGGADGDGGPAAAAGSVPLPPPLRRVVEGPRGLIPGEPDRPGAPGRVRRRSDAGGPGTRALRSRVEGLTVEGRHHGGPGGLSPTGGLGPSAHANRNSAWCTVPSVRVRSKRRQPLQLRSVFHAYT